MSTGSTFVLEPGAAHGGWQWAPVARRLRAAGHQAITLTPPGFGSGDDRSQVQLSDATDQIVRTVVERDLDDVTLVAHSWGGYPVTAAAHQLADRVSKIVFYSALVPAPGVPLVDENPDYAAMIRADIAASPDKTTAIRREQAPMLVPGAPEPVVDLLFELLEPVPGRYYTDALDLPDLTTLGIELTYLLSENDQVLARPGTEFAARIGLSPIIVPGGHDGMLTHPDAIAEALLR